MDDITKAYAIKYDGKFLQKVRNSWSPGFEWVNTISEARLYASESALDKHLLIIARSCPNDGT